MPDVDDWLLLCDPAIVAILDEMARQDPRFVRYAHFAREFAREFAARVDRRVYQHCGPPRPVRESRAQGRMF